MTTQVEQTLNVTVAQIEDALLAGQTVPDFAREWSEPPANVLAIYRRLQREGRIPVNGPAQVATTPTTRPLASVPMNPSTGSSAALSIDTLVAAAARSESKRTQALGVKLADLAAVVRSRLAEEREAAEAAEREHAKRVAAKAEVERLEEQLRTARAKLRPVRQGGVRSMPQRESDRPPLTEKRQAQIEAMRAKNVNTDPCAKGCGFVAKSKGGKSSHESACAGAS